NNAHVPIELARFLVRPSKENTEHVQFDSDYHQVRGPAMHVAQQLAERHIVLEIQNIAERLHLARMVVKHQQHTGKGEDDEQIKRYAAHTPGVAVTHRIPVDLRRMQMEEN